MKKIFICVLCIMLLCTFVACSKTVPPTDADVENDEVMVEPEEDIVSSELVWSELDFMLFNEDGTLAYANDYKSSSGEIVCGYDKQTFRGLKLGDNVDTLFEKYVFPKYTKYCTNPFYVEPVYEYDGTSDLIATIKELSEQNDCVMLWVFFDESYNAIDVGIGGSPSGESRTIEGADNYSFIGFTIEDNEIWHITIAWEGVEFSEEALNSTI